MSTIERSIGIQRPRVAGGWRSALVGIALVVSLATGFGLGRIAAGGDVVEVPSVPGSSLHGTQGPGHVPRHRTEQVDGNVHAAGTPGLRLSSLAPVPVGKDSR
jgi:hypothetical protein